MMLCIVLVVTACSGNEGKKSHESKGEAGNEKKTVVISVMMKDRFLESAIREFEEKHNNIHIEIKEYKSTVDSGSGGMNMVGVSIGDIEKYVQSVTTQVISGKGPDIMLMNELPNDKFVEKKLLANLSEMMTKDSSFDQNSFYSNILEASKDGDNLYVIPLAFSLDLVRGNTDLLKEANIKVDKNEPWSWNQYKEIARQLKEKGYDSFGNPSAVDLLFDYIEDNYDQLVGQGKPGFDSELFRNMMQDIKQMNDEGLLNEGMTTFSTDFTKVAFRMAGIYGARDVLTIPSYLEYYQKPSASDEKRGVPFRSLYSLGINSKSNVQSEAWEFIKFLLTDEIQLSPELFGLPINKNVVVEKLNDFLQDMENGTLNMPISVDTIPDADTAKKRIEEAQRLISEAGFRKNSDTKVLMMAYEEFTSFISGQKSAEEVSKLIQSKVKTYLNE